jgi:hypothetical protein
MIAAALATLLTFVAQPSPDALARDSQIRAEQQMARQREVIRDNETTAYETRAQTEHNLRVLQAQAASPDIPAPRDRSSSSATLAAPNMGGAAAIPDDTLAASNRRVMDIAGKRP